MRKHFVTFFSPGTFVAEQTTQTILEWNVAAALRMASDIVERYGAKPYAFQFTTRARNDDELDSRVVERSHMYYFGVRVRTLAEIKAEGDTTNDTLIRNMETNGWRRIVTTIAGYRWSQPLNDGDVVLDSDGRAIEGK